MARRRDWVTSVEAGELAPEYALRTDAVVRNRGLLRARNVRLRSGGGWERRWGTRRKVAYTGDVRYETIGVGESLAVLFAFGAGRLDIYDEAWTLLQSITTGCPWVAADLHTMQVAAEKDRVTVTSRSFFPQEITRPGTGGTWSIAAKSWAPGQGSSIKQPYYRFQLPGVSLTPSATSGTGITLTTSAAHWQAAHVGTRVRYVGQEIEITGYTSATVVTGNVIGALYPTLTVPVVSSTGFQVGDVVEGEDTKVQGVVVAVPSGTSLTVLLTGGYGFFEGGTTNENLIGPNQRTKLTAACTATTPAGSADWDEQLISAVRGYPAGCGYHRGRQLLVDFPNAPNLLCASSPGDPDDYDTGEAGNADAVIETVGRDDTLRIRYVASMEQLLIFTDAGVYYVPEGGGAVFSPTFAEFLLIGPEAVGDCAPVRVAEGVMFAEARSGRILVLIPTGNVRRSWEPADLSELAFHLMGAPKKIVVLPAVQGSDREVVVLKQDGTIAWMRYRRGQEVAGWCPWDTAGQWRTVTVVDGRLYLSAQRTVAGSTVHWGEEMDPLAILDGSVVSGSSTWSHLANASGVTVAMSRQTIWQGTLSGTGTSAAQESWWVNPEAGFASTVEAEYPPPIDGENGQMRPLAIVRAFLSVRDSGSFRVSGYEMGAFGPESAEDALPPLWSGVREHWVPGFDWARTLTITQEIPAPLAIQAVTMEVKA